MAPLIDSYEVYKFSVFLNIDVQLLNVGLVVEDIFLNSGLALEETLQSGLAHGHLIQLSLLGSLLLFGLLLHNDELVSSLHGIHHASDFEGFTLEPDPDILERSFPQVDVGNDVSWHIWGGRVGQDSLGPVLL